MSLVAQRFLAGLLSVAIFAGSALAAAPEKCGNGIDDPLQTGGSPNGTKGSCPAGFMDSVIGNGCDRKCPGIDLDDDGYTSDGSLGTAEVAETDCDDTSRDIFPGVVTELGCSAGQHRTCQTDGTYTACTATTLCEATGGGQCYYVDFDTGSNANPCSFASPCATLSKFAGGSSGSPPASPITLVPGDHVYILGGSSVQGDTYSDGTRNVVAQFNSDGTPSDPIVLKRYPGSTATITTTNAAGVWINGDNYINEDIDISTARTSIDVASSFRVTGSNVLFERVYVHDTGLNGDNNDAAIYCGHTNGCRIQHSYFENIKRDTACTGGPNPCNIDNIAANTWLDDAGIATECQNHASKWNTIWFDTFDSANNGACFREKHGCDAVDVGVNKHPIQYNSCIQAKRGIYWNSSSLRASDNYYYGVPTTLYLRFGDEDAELEDNEFTFSTLVDSSMISNDIPTLSVGDSLLLFNNILQDNKASYVAGNGEGIISICPYCSDAQKTTYESIGILTSDENCFWNTVTTLVFSAFSMTSGTAGLTIGPAGPAGGNYSFANWQLNESQDLNSFVEDPAFDSWLQATSANCTDKGRRYTLTPSVNPETGGVRMLRYKGKSRW